MSKQMGALPIAFPAILYKNNNTRWFIDGAGRFMVDTRNRTIGPIASMMTKPGIWTPDTERPGRLKRGGDFDTTENQTVIDTLTAAHERNGQPCSIMGDDGEVFRFDSINDIDVEDVVAGPRSNWSIIDNQSGEQLGLVDGGLFFPLAGTERMEFEFTTLPSGKPAVVGYWERSGNPAMILIALLEREEPECEPVDLDAPLQEGGNVTPREAEGIVAELIAATINQDTEAAIADTERLMDRMKLLDPYGDELPPLILMMLAAHTAAILPPDLKGGPLRIEIEGDLDESDPTKLALSILVGHVNDDTDASGAAIGAAWADPDRFFQVMVAMLAMFKQCYADVEATS